VAGGEIVAGRSIVDCSPHRATYAADVAAEVRVVRIELDQPADVVAALDAALPAGERAVHPHRRVARAATRVLLAAELSTDPGRIEITRRCRHCGDPAHGKPALVGAGPSFAVSHSGGLALIALGPPDAALGVDVEIVRPRRHLARLAARVLTPGEHERWLAHGARIEDFLARWSAKEAYLKATGVGITTALADVDAARQGWSNVTVAAGSGYVAAVAIDRVPVAVTVEDWVSASAGIGG
jgi:4'-phosphopantetheinyl transferase